MIHSKKKIERETKAKRRKKSNPVVKREIHPDAKTELIQASEQGNAHRTLPSRYSLIDETRKTISRSEWTKYGEEQLSRKCRELLEKLKKTCPQLNLETPLKPGEVLGELSVKPKQLQSIVSIASGTKDNPEVVWCDGTNELLVEMAGISVKTADELVLITIPVSCEETGSTIVQVAFATGSAENPAGLVFATDTIPDGPPEITEIWGESLIALAWKSITVALSAMAGAAGTDLDGAGLIPAGLSADRSGVKLIVMARHEMDRISR